MQTLSSVTVFKSHLSATLFPSPKIIDMRIPINKGYREGAERERGER